jgi:predicted RNA-binding protein (virulence factor B family)
MIEIGQISRVKVNEKVAGGYKLQDIESPNQVFMPFRLCSDSLEENTELNVFVYVDANGDTVATQQLPYAVVGEYCVLDVKEVQDFGAFFHWGINKDLLVPGNEQKIEIREGEEHLVRICLEEGTNRVYGSTKLGKFIENTDFDIFEKDEVIFVPVRQTDLGFRVIINKKYIGMVYHSEIFTDVLIGETYKGYVKKIRTDGLVDVALQVQGIKNLDNATYKIMEMLIKRGGSSTLNDKSSPEEIRRVLGMSKKSFKNAIGMLYKKRKIIISPEGIKLTKKK